MKDCSGVRRKRGGSRKFWGGDEKRLHRARGRNVQDAEKVKRLPSLDSEATLINSEDKCFFTSLNPNYAGTRLL